MNHTASAIISQLFVDAGQATVFDSDAETEWPVMQNSLVAVGTTFQNANAIALYDTSGIKQARSMQGQTHSNPGLQLRVRGVDESAVSQKIAALQTYMDTVKRATVTLDGSVYRVNVLIQSGTPFPLGREDDTPYPEFILNCVASISLVSEPTTETLSLLSDYPRVYVLETGHGILIERGLA